MFAGLESPVKKETLVKKDIKKEVKKTPTRRSSEPKIKEEWEEEEYPSEEYDEKSKETDAKKDKKVRFNCEYCDNTFSRKDHVRRHVDAGSCEGLKGKKKAPAKKPPRRNSESKIKEEWDEEDEVKKKAPAKKPPNRRNSEAKIKEEWNEEDYKPVKKKAPAKKKKSKKDSESNKKSSKQNDKYEDKNITPQERLLEKFKGPFVHVEGEIDNPVWSNVVNFANDPIDQHESMTKGMKFLVFIFSQPNKG